ncbi:hypothetical protein KI387_003610, partial [Taxus chinensis]
ARASIVELTEGNLKTRIHHLQHFEGVFTYDRALNGSRATPVRELIRVENKALFLAQKFILKLRA